VSTKSTVIWFSADSPKEGKKCDTQKTNDLLKNVCDPYLNIVLRIRSFLWNILIQNAMECPTDQHTGAVSTDNIGKFSCLLCGIGEAEKV
jgi:hypothetical protein